MNNTQAPDIRSQLREVHQSGEVYFGRAKEFCPPASIKELDFYTNPEAAWNKLPEDLRIQSSHIIDSLLAVSALIAQSGRGSALVDSEDISDLRRATKSAQAALRLRKYRFHEADVIHDEGTVLGFRPASQSEDFPLEPQEAASEFVDQIQRLASILKLVEASPTQLDNATNAAEPKLAQKYRAGTAFIMMWMDPTQPELLDVMDTVKTTFRSFDISAVRADDIEHEGLISERILNEIRSAEFLFADLSGARQNVYYEVGYAHALGKRVILYRKSGTGLHFDLSNYNCPEYDNQRDLREKLTKRLIGITNRNPKSEA